MGINPETYAPVSPSSPIAATAAATSSFPATRHMAQWESARLEAEARLSRESLIFSASVDTTSAADSGLPPAKPEPDFFLRIWNSEAGDEFRKPTSAFHLAIPKESSPASSSSTKSVSAADVSEVESKSCVSGGGGDVMAGATDSSSSNEEAEEDTSDESYQMYLDFSGHDLGLFHGSQLGSCFSIFSSDVNDAFK